MAWAPCLQSGLGSTPQGFSKFLGDGLSCSNFFWPSTYELNKKLVIFVQFIWVWVCKPGQRLSSGGCWLRFWDLFHMHSSMEMGFQLPPCLIGQYTVQL